MALRRAFHLIEVRRLGSVGRKKRVKSVLKHQLSKYEQADAFTLKAT